MPTTGSRGAAASEWKNGRRDPPSRPGPTYPSGWSLLGPVARLLASQIGYAVRRKEYPQFRLRALLALPSKDVVRVWRLTRLGPYYYGASLRTPRWPSPAFDRMMANGGMNLAPGLLPHKQHIDTAILGITRRCTYDCEHCYDHANRADTDTVPVERWVEVMRRLEQLGVSVIVLSGGEPMLRYEDLLTLLDHHNPRLADIHIHSCGADVTPERALELKTRGLVAAGIGLDFPDAGRHDRFRRKPGAFADAVRALEAFSDACVFTYTNVCLTRELLADGGLYKYLDLARDLRVGVVQLLEPKPCGRYALRDPSELLAEEDRGKVRAFFRAVNGSRRFAGYPPVAYPALFERPENFGCLMGGLAHLAIDSRGEVCPCIFVPVSFGNILREDLDAIVARMRTVNARARYRECPAVVLGGAIGLHRTRTGRPVVHYDEFRTEWERLLMNG